MFEVATQAQRALVLKEMKSKEKATKPFAPDVRHATMKVFESGNWRRICTWGYAQPAAATVDAPGEGGNGASASASASSVVPAPAVVVPEVAAGILHLEAVEDNEGSVIIFENLVENVAIVVDDAGPQADIPYAAPDLRRVSTLAATVAGTDGRYSKHRLKTGRGSEQEA